MKMCLWQCPLKALATSELARGRLSGHVSDSKLLHARQKTGATDRSWTRPQLGHHLLCHCFFGPLTAQCTVCCRLDPTQLQLYSQARQHLPPFFHGNCQWLEKGMGKRAGGGPETAPTNDSSREKGVKLKMCTVKSEAKCRNACETPRSPQ